MIFLEDYLKDGGKLYISPIQENHLSLRTKFFGNVHVVDTQKGIRYLLEYIEQILAGNKDLLCHIENKYPYSISWNNLTPLDHLLNRTTIHLYAIDKVIHADLYQIHISDKSVLPGIQRCRLKTETKRVLELLNENPKNFETIPFPKDIESIESLY